MILYSDIDPYCCAWLENLIKAGALPKGDVLCIDMRQMECVPVKYHQFHACCGIGGWPLALQIAGWPKDRPVFTASVPCQPFSVAGKRKGVTDDRHLWPAFFRLVQIAKPDTVFGEQVEGAVGHGWLDGVFGDLEREGYACGAVVLGAHSVGAPHIRQRLYWVADCERNRLEGGRSKDTRRSAQGVSESGRSGSRGSGKPSGVAQSNQRERGRIADREGSVGNGEKGGRVEGYGESESGSEDGGLAKSDGGFAGNRRVQRSREHGQQQEDGGAGGVDLPPNTRRTGKGSSETSPAARDEARVQEFTGRGASGNRRLGDATGQGLQKRARGTLLTGEARSLIERSSNPSPWEAYDQIWCLDGKSRRVEPGTFPLAHGVPGRVGRLRGYGNAIIPQVAAEFISAYLAVEADQARLRELLAKVTNRA
jgi:DNA (cytosine-5)-methyltransferase 1